MHPFYYSLSVFGIMEFVGDIYPGYIANHHCFAILGCNLGPVGYEGLMHFLSGICVALGLMWAHERGYLRAPSAMAFFVWSAAIAIGWELLEWGYDLVRMHILSMNLLTPNNLAQPNSADTIGDVVLALLGTALVYFFYRWRTKA